MLSTTPNNATSSPQSPHYEMARRHALETVMQREREGHYEGDPISIVEQINQDLETLTQKNEGALANVIAPFVR